MAEYEIFTSESVSEGHPDKVCDRISDAVLDAFIAEEPEARVACETFATTNRVVIGGEVGLSDKAKLSEFMGRIDEIARTCVKDIGYEQEKFHHEELFPLMYTASRCCSCHRGQSPSLRIGEESISLDTTGITRPCTKQNWFVKDI